MNKAEYLNNLLGLCTEKQTTFFYRMYPDGPAPSQVPHATSQLENTLKGLNSTTEELKRVERAGLDNQEKHNAEIKLLNKALSESVDQLVKSRLLVERLRNPINIANNEVQERLNLLSALEAGGVDGWNFYDESISEWEKQQ